MSQPSALTRIIRCYNCQGMMRVAARALSVFCPHCHKRVTVEDLRVSGAYPSKLLATCGHITVEAGAKLNLDLVCDSAEILGRINGNIRAAGTVELGRTGLVVGDIECRNVVVREGGVLRGRCRPAQRRSPLKKTASRPDRLPPASEAHRPDPSSASKPSPDTLSMAPAVRPRPLMPPKTKQA